MILVTGASGKTGLAIIRALSRTGKSTRAYIRDAKQQSKVLDAGANEFAIGDLGNEQEFRVALKGVSGIYFIAPNVHQKEIEFGQLAIRLCLEIKLEHFAYHSVLYPQIESMPHHWKKLRVEEMLITSGLNFTILQPANYMQNILGYRESIANNGQFHIPYDLKAKSTPIDLMDLAESAASVIGNRKHFGAIYPLAGPEALSTIDQAKLIAKHIGKDVKAIMLDRAIWKTKALEGGLSGEAIATLTSMFAYYDGNNFIGNSKILAMLLCRQAIRFEAFLKRDW